jgi:hypothetical protein
MRISARNQLSVAMLVAAFVAASGATIEAAAACDRDCLTDIAASYVAGLAHNAPGRAPLSDDFAFVENVTALERGEGLWASAVGAVTGFLIVVPDPVAGTVGLMMVMGRRTPDGVVPAQVAIRLKIEDREVTEAEHLIADIESPDARARLQAPRPGLTAVVPEGERGTRAELAAIAASYYDSLDESDGTLAPFADDCERQENGMITASSELAPAPFDSVDVNGRSPPPVARDCVGQMSSRRFAYIDSIDNRRVFAVDPVQGLAMGLSHFRQSMRRGPHVMIAADGSQVMWEEKRDPYDLPAAHIFKITGGEIHQVEAIGIFVPYDSPTGWE